MGGLTGETPEGAELTQCLVPEAKAICRESQQFANGCGARGEFLGGFEVAQCLAVLGGGKRLGRGMEEFKRGLDARLWRDPGHLLLDPLGKVAIG